jgi:ATP-dependent Clp protease ATP-binding subunit ClpA
MVVTKGITIKIDDKALDVLVDKGFDPKMGARPLQRVIDKEIKRPLSREMLFGSLKDGGKVTININSDNDFILDVTEKEAVLEEG